MISNQLFASLTHDDVLAEVQSRGWVLEYATEAFRNDREIVLAAVSQNSRALRFASDALKNDREIVH
jgi:hypothetical protein